MSSNDLTTTKQPRWINYVILAVIAAGSMAVIWWYRPGNAENRYRKMSLVSLRQMLDRDPDNAKGWKQLGMRLAMSGDLALAQPALEHALQLNQTDSEVAARLGEIWMRTGKIPEAFQLLKAASAIRPGDIRLHKDLGQLYLNQRSFQHAADELTEVVKSDPRADDAYYQLASCYYEMQKMGEAKSAIETALIVHPAQPQYISLQSTLSIALGNVAAGIQQAKQAANLAPTNLRIQAGLVNTLLDHESTGADLTSAEEAIGKIEQISPQYPMITFQRGKLELLRGNWQAAIRYLEKAMAANPQIDEVYFSLSQAYRRSGRVAEADKLLNFYRKHKEIHRQIDEINIVLANDPSDIKQIIKLVDFEMQLGDRDAAISTVKSGLKTVPGQPVLTGWLKQLDPASAASQ